MSRQQQQATEHGTAHANEASLEPVVPPDQAKQTSASRTVTPDHAEGVEEGVRKDIQSEECVVASGLLAPSAAPSAADGAAAPCHDVDPTEAVARSPDQDVNQVRLSDPELVQARGPRFHPRFHVPLGSVALKVTRPIGVVCVFKRPIKSWLWKGILLLVVIWTLEKVEVAESAQHPCQAFHLECRWTCSAA